MNAALEKYRDALKNPGLSNNAIAKMAKVPEADVVAARAELAAIEVAPVVEVAEQVEAVAEVVADVADAVAAPKVEAVAEAVVEAAEIVEELDLADLTEQVRDVKRHVYEEPAKVEALTREPGAAVRALRSQRIVDAKGRPWDVRFRDVYTGDKADFLADRHPSLVETYPRPKG